MDFSSCYNTSPCILMEGALGERLKREYNIQIKETVALACLIYEKEAMLALQSIYMEYIKIAEKHRLPLMLNTPTRRANVDRVSKSNFDKKIIKDNVDFLRNTINGSTADIFIGGQIGCKGDAYKATDVLPINEAVEYHSWQANLFKEAKVDYLYAAIMPALPEAIGIAKAMENTGLPYIISFMIRDNGRLIDGTTIDDAIKEIDNYTANKPLCYMVTCVHPAVLKSSLSFPFNKTPKIKERFHGIQANTSILSPEELENCCELKTSDSVSLASEMMDLHDYFLPKILGGCCGTDDKHIDEIAKRIKNYFPVI